MVTMFESHVLMCWHRLAESLTGFLSLHADYQSGTISGTRTVNSHCMKKENREDLGLGLASLAQLTCS